MGLALGMFLVGAGIAVLVLGTARAEVIEEPPIVEIAPEEEIPEEVEEVNIIAQGAGQVFVTQIGL